MSLLDYSGVSVALQPICNIHSGHCFGYEALVRGWEDFGCDSAEGLLASAESGEALFDLERAVRRKALTMIGQIAFMSERLLFVNLSPGTGAHWGALMEEIRGAAQSLGTQLVSDVSAFPDGVAREDWVKALKAHGGLLAIDHFGCTADSLRLMADCDPDFIKIDRSLVRGIDQSPRKRVMLAQLVGLAHTLGIEVIAVGVESGPELTVCRELGCDLVQGFLVQKPFSDPAEAMEQFHHLDALSRDDRRRRRIDQKWVLQQLDALPAVKVDTPLKDVFERFGRLGDATVIPVVDHAGRALGVLRERDLKGYAYSTYGRDLLVNRSMGRTLHDHMVRCPMADIATPLDQMLAVYSSVEDAEGILVTEQMIYRGFLSARSIIRAMHEKTLARARDENPLTKLPGNTLITDYVGGILAGDEGGVLAYVDFDNFKPFNDTYGFRQGDRAILLFSELASKLTAHAEGWFLGHIGGDDFFLGLKDVSLAEASETVGSLIARFAQDAESFYDAAARARGFIQAHDREGNPKTFPLLSASAVLVEVAPGAQSFTLDDVSAAIALKKHAAKAAPSKLATAVLGSRADDPVSSSGH